MSELNCDDESLLLLTTLFLSFSTMKTREIQSKFSKIFPGDHACPRTPLQVSTFANFTRRHPPPPSTENPCYAPVWIKRHGANSVIYGTYKCVVGLWIYKINSLTLFYLLKLKYNRELRIEKSFPFNARKATKNVARTDTTTFADVL